MFSITNFRHFSFLKKIPESHDINGGNPLTYKREIHIEGELNPSLRLLVSGVRSGSTALAMALLNNPDVYRAFYQFIKTGIRDMGVPNYELFFNNLFHTAGESGKITFTKETFGPYNEAESTFPLFPPEKAEDAIATVRPIYLFRDPDQIVSAVFRRGWNKKIGSIERTVELLRLSLDNLFQSYTQAKEKVPEGVVSITYDQLVDPNHQENILKAMCKHWEIRYSSLMQDWEITFAEATDNERQTMPSRKFIGGIDFYRLIGAGAFDNLMEAKNFYPVNTAVMLPDEIQQPTRKKFGEIVEQYQEIQNDSCNLKNKIPSISR